LPRRAVPSVPPPAPAAARCRSARGARSAPRAALRARARAPRCVSGAPGFPCGSTPPPSPACGRTRPTASPRRRAWRPSARRIDARLLLPRTGDVEIAVQSIELAQCRVALLGRHAMARRVVAREQITRRPEPRRDDVERRALQVARHLLLEPRHRGPRLPHHL